LVKEDEMITDWEHASRADILREIDRATAAGEGVSLPAEYARRLFVLAFPLEHPEDRAAVRRQRSESPFADVPNEPLPAAMKTSGGVLARESQ
jgi:hypothetical protein